MTVGSLFAGIGGFDLGFTRAGYDIAWQVEIDPFCRAVLAKHWPDVKRVNDVRVAHAYGRGCDREPTERGAVSPRRGRVAKDCEGCLSYVDVLVGGFPCQDVSLAGKQAGLDGARSGLWWEFHRLIGELRPRYVVVENVPGLFIHGFGDVLGGLAALGYDAEWTVIRASDVGAPHQRARVWIVAYPQSAGHGGWSLDGSGRALRARSAEESGESETWGITQTASGCGAAVADPSGDGLGWGGQPESRGQQGACGHVADRCGNGRTGTEAVADAAEFRRERLPAVSRGAGASKNEGWMRESTRGGAAWPAGPGEPQHAWEPPRVLRHAESGVGVHADGLSRGLVRHRRRALAAIGNAIVPQIAEWIAHQIKAHAEGRVAA